MVEFRRSRLSDRGLLIVIGMAFVWGFVGIHTSWSEERAALVSGEKQESSIKWSSTATDSCGGRSCHGAIQPVPGANVRQFELMIWRNADRHATSMRTLRGEWAQRISAALAEEGNPPVPSDQDVRCLACHASATNVELQGTQTLAWNPLGIGCESCHGEPKSWINQHHGWRTQSPAESGTSLQARLESDYAKHDMNWLGDPLARAAACMKCHVGAPAEAIGHTGVDIPVRDVNHDLIAAGHPRLHFDLNEYLQAMPPHWTERADVVDAGVRNWAAGEWESMRAWLKLLEERASDERKSTWPELAEWNCYSCHQELASVSADRGLSTHGLPTWGNQYRPMLKESTWILHGESVALPPALAQLDDEWSRWNPNRTSVQAQNRLMLNWMTSQTAAARKRLDQPIEIVGFRQQLAKVVEGKDANGGRSWDGGAELYLAWRALERDGRLSDSESQSLSRCRALLTYSKDMISPRGFHQRSNELKATFQSLGAP